MLVVTNNEDYRYYTVNDEVFPLKYEGDCYILTDPSKTNMAIAVVSVYGDIIEIIEVSGNNRRKGPVQDTTIYLSEVKSYLDKRLKLVNVLDGGIEAAITKEGMSHHHSSQVLTEIRGVLLNYFLDKYNIRLEEINNYSWKTATLPQGYRGHGEKGSKRFFLENFPDNPITRYFEADATDVVLMSRYFLQSRSVPVVKCNKRLTLDYKYQYTIVPDAIGDGIELNKFIYNPNFSVQDNLKFYSGMTKAPGKVRVPIAALTPDDIVDHASCFTSPETGEYAFITVWPQ